MDKAQSAELLIRPLMKAERAKELVGDFLEYEANGREPFWGSIMKTFVHPGGRWLLAILVAGVLVVSVMYQYVAAFHSEIATMRHISISLGSALAAACTWSATILHTIRYGPHHRTNVVGLILASCLSALACSPHRPLLALLGWASLAICVFTCLATRYLRDSFLNVVLTSAIHAVFFTVLCKLILHPTITAAAPLEFCLAWFASFTAAAFVLAQRRRLLLG